MIAKLTLGALAWGDIWYGGKTRNPWDIEKGSSGSSAGPGSATAAGANTVNTQDVSLTKIDRSAYAALPNKLALGQPSQYYVDRQEIPKIYLYQAPNLNTYTVLKYYVIKRIQDAGAYTNDADVVFRFLPCMVAGLAYYLAMKNAPTLVQQNKLIYEDQLKRALDEDGQRASTYITPQSFYPNGI